MKRSKHTATSNKVKKKIEEYLWAFYWLIVIFAILLFITLLRSQILSFWNLALDSNQPCRADDNTGSSLLFFSAAGRFPAGLQPANNQPKYAVGYTQSCSRNNGRWPPPVTGRPEPDDRMVEPNKNPLRKAGGEPVTGESQLHPPLLDWLDTGLMMSDWFYNYWELKLLIAAVILITLFIRWLAKNLS